MGDVVRLGDDLQKVLGAKTGKVLGERLGLNTVGDFVHHFPRRYIQLGELTDFGSLAEGEHVTIVAEVAKKQGRVLSRKPNYVLEITVKDAIGREVSLSFFTRTGSNKPDRDLRPGVLGMFAGKISFYRLKDGSVRRQLTHPDYQVIPSADLAEELVRRPLPLYPATKGMESWKIKDAMAVVLDTLEPIEDP